MLKAVEVGTLVEELSWRLDSVCTWSNQAFAGTSDGHILSFALGDSDKEDRASDSKAKGRPKRVCRSPITQLATSSGNSTLFALASSGCPPSSCSKRLVEDGVARALNALRLFFAPGESARRRV